MPAMAQFEFEGLGHGLGEAVKKMTRLSTECAAAERLEWARSDPTNGVVPMSWRMK